MSQFNFDEIIENLERSIKENRQNPEEFRKTLEILSDLKFRLQETFEYAWKASNGEKKEEFRRLYYRVTNDNLGEMCDKLRNYGYILRRKNDVFKRFYNNKEKRPEGIVYRIMELTRLGKRDEVFFTLLNLFQGEEINVLLARVFSPIYSDEMFKIFIYSFLSGVLGESPEQKEEV